MAGMGWQLHPTGWQVARPEPVVPWGSAGQSLGLQVDQGATGPGVGRVRTWWWWWELGLFPHSRGPTATSAPSSLVPAHAHTLTRTHAHTCTHPYRRCLRKKEHKGVWPRGAQPCPSAPWGPHGKKRSVVCPPVTGHCCPASSSGAGGAGRWARQGAGLGMGARASGPLPKKREGKATAGD